MTTAVGRITSVFSQPQGSALRGSALTGATVLQVESAMDFNESGGELLLEDGRILAYMSADPDNDIVTLSLPLDTNAWVAPTEENSTGDNDYFVAIYPRSNEYKATVEFHDDDDEGVQALIPLEFQPYFLEGLREAGQEERVVVSDEGGEWRVTEVADELKIQGTVLDQGSPIGGVDLGELAAAIDDAKKRLDDLFIGDTETGAEAILDNLEEVAYQANDTATTADGRISISDFEPLSEDREGRVNGSVWFTRTRSRKNLCTHPSAEAGIGTWTASEGVLSQFAAPAISGGNVFKMVNNGSLVDKYIEFPDISVVESQVLTCSKFASGVGTGVYGSIRFYDASNVQVGAVVSSPVFSLLADDWERIVVTHTAPAGAVTARFRITSPAENSGSVWYTDGCLIESDNYAGRWFDGNSFDCTWDGAVNASTSTMEGGKIYKVFELDGNSWVPKFFSDDALADIDASSITHGNLQGVLISDKSIPLDKMSASDAIASEALSVGDFVNVYKHTDGTARVRKANAALLYGCHGFVLAPVASGEKAYVYSHGYNPFCVGLTPGRQYLATISGACTNVPPSATGTILQMVGVAFGTSLINFFTERPILLVD